MRLKIRVGNTAPEYGQRFLYRADGRKLASGYATGINGNDVVAYASQFLGNSYVLGGTSWTKRNGLL